MFMVNQSRYNANGSVYTTCACCSTRLGILHLLWPMISGCCPSCRHASSLPFPHRSFFAVVSARTCATPYSSNPATLLPPSPSLNLAPESLASHSLARPAAKTPYRSILLTTCDALLAILPFVAACSGLADLYSQILDNALDILASYPKLNQVVIEAGDIRLEFGCSKVPVPWDLIAEFAASEDAVKRGFARTWSWPVWERMGGNRRIYYVGFMLGGRRVGDAFYGCAGGDGDRVWRFVIGC